LGEYVRSIDPAAVLAMGPVPVVGKDERFRNGFTVRAEKCPNRRGVERILAGLAGTALCWAEFLDEVDRGEIRAAWISGGYKSDWIGESTAARLDRLELVAVQDLFPSALSRRATYALPGAAFAERDGTYVNATDLLQSFRRAIRPPSGIRTEGSLLWEISGRPGLYHARTVLGEITARFRDFAASAGVAG
jgi:NADH-quinone oxidoreductase subunit G